MAPRALIAGNWKMHGLQSSIGELSKMMDGARVLAGDAELLVCPPATLVSVFAAKARGSRIAIGAQDCHAEAQGAFTGDISAEMLADAGATAVIVGHSERRTLHAESDAQVRAKTLAGWRANLSTVVCVGETRAERESKQTLDVIGRQLAGSLPDGATAANLIVAYEPVWAIGTGLTPTVPDVSEAHRFIRERLRARFRAAGEAMRVLYGGSVKSANAGELLAIPNVDGALVGGASLKAEEFMAIAAAARSSRSG